MQEIEGVYVANVTPIKDDAALSVDVDSYLDHVSWLAEMGVRGVVPFGTNGEGTSLTLNEKLRVLEALFARDHPIQVIPAIMQGNLPETLKMVEALEEYPATAVLVLPPYYFKPASPEGLRRFFEPVLERTGHPVILYHIPKYAVPVPEEVVIDLPVWGVKDSGGREATPRPFWRATEACSSGRRPTSGSGSTEGRRALSARWPTLSRRRYWPCTRR